MDTLRDLTRYHFDWVVTKGAPLLGGDLPSESMWALVDPDTLSDPSTLNIATFAIMASVQELGPQVFELGPNMVSLFEATDIGTLKGSMLRLPYAGFYLHITGCGLVLEGIDAPDRELTGIYVLERDEVWWIGLVAHDEDRATALPFPWPARVWEESGETFDAFLDRYYEEHARDESAEVYKRALRIVTQTLLYLSSKDPELVDIESSGRRRLEKNAQRFKGKARGNQAERDLREYSRAKVTRIGSSFEVVNDDREAGGAASRKGAWVRGHWNYYWVGPKPDQTLEPRWLLPHWRRGADGEAAPEEPATRSYVLSDEPDPS